MTRFHEAFPSSSAWVTECSTGAWDLTPFNEALYKNMRLLIRSTRNWAEAVAKWNIALDDVGGPHSGGCTSCVGLLTVNRATGAVTLNADFYALGHFSKFVVPGARRIGSTTVESQGVESVAFVNPDGSHVLVVWNGWGTRRLRIAWNGSAFDIELPGDALTAAFRVGRWRRCAGACRPASTLATDSAACACTGSLRRIRRPGSGRS